MDNKYRELLVKLTRDMVDIPTVNLPPNGDEAAGQEYIKNVLAGLGLEITEFSPEQSPDFQNDGDFIKGQNYKGRKNVSGLWKGSGGGRSLILNGHMDVVTEEPGPWTKCEPFKSVVEGDRIYGRGTADMKGGLACSLVAIKMLKDEGFKPGGDIYFESVVDEEYASSAGSISARKLGGKADFAIITEPSGLMVCPACVGSIVVKLTMQGVAGMPYTGEKVVNPVYMLGEIIGLIKEYDGQRLARVKTPPLWKDTPQAAQIVITKAKSGDVRPHGQLTTPADAWIELVIQTYPHEDMRAVYDDFVQFVKSRFSQPPKLDVELEYHFCRAADMRADAGEGVEMLAKCASQYAEQSKVCGAMFSCDLFAFTLYGDMPGAVFGPVGEKLHGPDEWVSIKSMEKAAMAIHDFIVKWSA